MPENYLTLWEEFRLIPGWPNYEVSNYGRVKSLRRRTNPTHVQEKERFLKPILFNNGYHVVALYHEGKREMIGVHCLVLLAFVGPCPPGHVCRHFPDRTPTNNRLDNLQWGTRLENEADKLLQGGSNLTREAILAIRREWAEGQTQAIIAERYDTTSGNVSRIVNFKAWTEIK